MARNNRKRTRNSQSSVRADDDSAGEEGGGEDRVSGGDEQEGGRTMEAPSAGVGVSCNRPNVLSASMESYPSVEVSISCKLEQVESCSTEAGCIAETRVPCRAEEEERQMHEEKSIVLAMVHLLVIASKPISPYPLCRKSTMASFRSIRRFLSSSPVPLQSLFMQGLLAAMPALLGHSEKSVVVKKSVMLLGDITLNSYQSMMQIVNERMVLRSLLGVLNSAEAEVQKEACHTIANLASSTQGLRALCDLGAVENLMCLLFRVAGFITDVVGLGDIYRSINFTGEPLELSQTQASLLSRILEALDILTCDNFYEILGRIPEQPRISILKALQMMWKRFRSNRHPLLDGDHVCVLSKMIVWLTMEQEIPDGVDDGHGKLVKLLFGGLEAEFEHFWDEHWERSPFLMEEDVMGREVRAGLLKAWRAESDSFALEELLTRTLACPPFNSDELDASQIYKEVEKNLGKPLVFGQDIRLVKSVCTAGCTKQCSTHTVQEEDYHRIGLGANRNKDVCMYADVHTCIGAYESGYTIALRGLEFRCSQIAAMAEALAVCFGQATVGANLYMTPSNAQGFKPHHDDHCVLVWQLTGCKAWKLWAPKGVLPRLYSQEMKLENVFADEEDAFRVFLKEGSALYIPRGFPHAANTKMQSEARVIERPVKSCHECTQTCTKIPVGNCNGHTERYLQSYNVADAERTGCLNMNEDGLGLPALELLGSCSCMKKWEDSQWTSQKDTVQSLHITFGVEVEPPFELRLLFLRL